MLKLSDYIDKIESIPYSDSYFNNLVKGTKLSNAELNMLALPERFSTVEMAERIRVPLKSNVFDRISLALTPYLIDPISLIGDPSLAWIFIIAPTQSGKTVFLQTVVADAIAQDPGTLLYIFPDETNGKAALQEKVIDMIKETDFLYSHTIGNDKTNLSSRKVKLDNMTIWPAWSGSLGSLSSKPAKKIVLDEIRLMKLSIGKESNAVKLAEDRITTFSAVGQAQAYGVSTPAVKGDLLYKQMFIEGTVTTHWHFKCQNCGKYYIPMFFHMLRDCGEGVAHLHCPICKERQQEGHLKKTLLQDGAYGVKKKHFGTKEIPPIREIKKGFDRIVFRYCSMSSPFRSLQKILSEYKKTKNSIEDYKNFWQCWLADFWEDDISETSEEALRKRVKKGFLRGKVPNGTQFLTAGVDTQDDGFYVVVRAWSENFSHLVDAYFIPCHILSTDWRRIRKILDNRVNSRKWDGWMVSVWPIDIADGDHTRKIRDATSIFPRCMNIIGCKTNTQVTNIEYKSKLNYYSVKRPVYLEETERVAISPHYTLFDSPTQDYYTQFPNTRKIKEEHKKTGESIITWKKCGQDDYRSAETYAFMALDFLYEGTYSLRDMIGRAGFIENPAITIKVVTDESGNLSTDENTDTYEDDYESPYESIDEFENTDNWMNDL